MNSSDLFDRFKREAYLPLFTSGMNARSISNIASIKTPVNGMFQVNTGVITTANAITSIEINDITFLFIIVLF